MSRWVSARVDEIERLGVRALELEAWSGDEGDVLISDSRAEGEALYVVLAGRAAFTIDSDQVDAAFWAGTTVRTNFICNLGRGDPSKLFPRSPRLTFEEACRIE